MIPALRMKHQRWNVMRNKLEAENEEDLLENWVIVTKLKKWSKGWYYVCGSFGHKSFECLRISKIKKTYKIRFKIYLMRCIRTNNWSVLQDKIRARKIATARWKSVGWKGTYNGCSSDRILVRGIYQIEEYLVRSFWGKILDDTIIKGYCRYQKIYTNS